MKRDMELVRQVLLKVEDFEIPLGGFGIVRPWEPAMEIEGYNADQIGQHLAMLIDGGYIDSQSADMSATFRVKGLTWKGHEFLDAIRSPEIWRKTKDGLREIGGWSIDLAWQIAKAYGMQVAKEKLRIDL
jgi:hypothetical protein